MQMERKGTRKTSGCDTGATTVATVKTVKWSLYGSYDAPERLLRKKLKLRPWLQN